jgi:hypothetical protein
MHLHLPKPMHGWRAFFGEVGVVVLGILLALGAQQVVQDFQMRSDLREFRKTIDREIGLDVYAFDLRASQFGCDRQKIAELTKWLDQSRTAPTAVAIYPHGPLISSPNRSAWNSRDAETYRELPADVRQKYAMFYDDVDNEWEITKLELAAWSSLAAFSEAGPITLEDRRKVRATISLLRAFSGAEQGNIPATKQLADELGIKAVTPPDLPPEVIRQARTCPSVFEPSVPRA